MNSAQKVLVSEISTERGSPATAAILSQPVRRRVCFSQPGQRFFDFLSRRVCALDVLDNLPPQLREHFSAIYVPVSRSFKVEGRKPHGRRFQLAGSRIRDPDFRSVVRPFAVWLILHIATRTDRRFRLERKRLAPERKVGERRSDRVNGTSALSGGHTPGEQHRRHLGELRFYTQGLLPRDLLQQSISTTDGAALAFRFANSGTMAGAGSILMSCALAPPWSVDMGERNNLAGTMRAKAPRLERSPLDAKIEVIQNAPARASTRLGLAPQSPPPVYDPKAR